MTWCNLKYNMIWHLGILIIVLVQVPQQAEIHLKAHGPPAPVFPTRFVLEWNFTSIMPSLPIDYSFKDARIFASSRAANSVTLLLQWVLWRRWAFECIKLLNNDLHAVHWNITILPGPLSSDSEPGPGPGPRRTPASEPESLRVRLRLRPGARLRRSACWWPLRPPVAALMKLWRQWHSGAPFLDEMTWRMRYKRLWDEVPDEI